MGQKMDPNGLRLGIIKDWNSFFKDAPIKEIVVVKGY